MSPSIECGTLSAIGTDLAVLGQSLIPQYQRDLPDDDPDKIHFRFYVVDEKNIRADLFCYEGLVLVPGPVFNRLRNEQQLAAVIADGIAASLLRQQARMATSEWAAFLATAPAIGMAGAGLVGVPIVKHEMARKMEDQRGRVALGLLSDAGFDPWQAPEAWRLLEPKKLPKNPEKLKYPDRAGYQLEILGLQYKRAASSSAAMERNANTGEKSN